MRIDWEGVKFFAGGLFLMAAFYASFFFACGMGW